MGDNYCSGACRLHCNRFSKCLSEKPVEQEDKQRVAGGGEAGRRCGGGGGSTTVASQDTQPGAITVQALLHCVSRGQTNIHRSAPSLLGGVAAAE